MEEKSVNELKLTVNIKDIVEQDLVRIDLEGADEKGAYVLCGYSLFGEPNDALGYKVSKCTRKILNGYSAFSKHAFFYHDKIQANGKNFNYNENEYYVICPRKYLDEGKKLLLNGFAVCCEREIQKKEEELQELKKAKARWEKEYNDIPDLVESNFGVYCTVTYFDKDGLDVREEEVYRPQGYKKIERVKELISHAEHSVGFDFVIQKKGKHIVGMCWKEDLEVCKRMVLDAELSLIREEKEKMTEEFNTNEKFIEDLMK